jgi:DNA-binding NarL/FixJ family response regulator
MRILIADDSEVMRRAVRGLLSTEPGWEVCGEAADGPGAFEKARELQPHLVLLDINMPGTTGLQTARRIRQEVPLTKILIMTLHDAARFLPAVREAGADGCVDKARLGNDLIDMIKKLLEPMTGEPHSVDN